MADDKNVTPNSATPIVLEEDLEHLGGTITTTSMAKKMNTVGRTISGMDFVEDKSKDSRTLNDSTFNEEGVELSDVDALKQKDLEELKLASKLDELNEMYNDVSEDYDSEEEFLGIHYRRTKNITRKDHLFWWFMTLREKYWEAIRGIVLTFFVPLLVTILDIIFGLWILPCHRYYLLSVNNLYFALGFWWKQYCCHLIFPKGFEEPIDIAFVAFIGGGVHILFEGWYTLTAFDTGRDPMSMYYPTLALVIPLILDYIVLPWIYAKRHWSNRQMEAPELPTTYIAPATWYLIFTYYLGYFWMGVSYSILFLVWIPGMAVLAPDLKKPFRQSPDHVAFYLFVVGQILPNFGAIIFQILRSPAVIHSGYYDVLFGFTNFIFLGMIQGFTAFMKKVGYIMSSPPQFVSFVFRAQFIDNFFAMAFFSLLDISNVSFWIALTGQGIWTVFRNPGLVDDTRDKVQKIEEKNPLFKNRVYKNRFFAINLNNQIKMATQYVITDLFALLAIPVQVSVALPFLGVGVPFTLCQYDIVLDPTDGRILIGQFWARYLILFFAKIWVHVGVYLVLRYKVIRHNLTSNEDDHIVLFGVSSTATVHINANWKFFLMIMVSSMVDSYAAVRLISSLGDCGHLQAVEPRPCPA